MPSRFREDANAEESLSIGYRDRVIAELAANGADAARAAGVPGAIAIELDPGGRELRVANTGAPLDAAGVAALASLRASAKRDSATVGHFGVGFTAVRALTDEPMIVSTTGAVRFSAAETRARIADLGSAALNEELRRRGDQVPALRLPFPVPAPSALPDGYVTCVRLPLRVDVDVDALAASLTPELAADLLWALPELIAVTVPGYRVERAAAPQSGIERITVTPAGPAADGTREEQDHLVLRRDGAIPAALLADRPVEERRRTGWRLAWIVPLDADGHPAEVTTSTVGAPTPTAEPIDLPARLVITAPVDESRGRVAAGPLADFLVSVAAQAYADVVRHAPAADRLALLPPVSFPLGEFDGALRDAVAAALERTEFLSGASGLAIRPGDAVVVPSLRGPAAECAAAALPGLFPWPSRPVELERLRRLGVRVLPVAALTEALAQLDRPVSFWRIVYDGLADVPADELADLPVPKPGGGTTVGPRGVLLPAHSGLWAERAARLVPGLRLAADGADHPLLRRLGAVSADAAAVLADPSVVREIRRRLADLDAGLDDEPDLPDAADFAALVLDLLGSAGGAAGAGRAEVPLSDVLLTDADGELWPAGSLLLPGAPLASVLADDADLPVVAPHWVAEYGAELLETLGVRSGFGLTRFALPPGADVDLPDVEAWWAEQSGWHGDELETAIAITDLDLVDAAAWPAALTMIAGHRETRDALRPSSWGRSYSAWWLAHHAVIHGVPLGRWRAAGTAELAGLYDELPVDLPAEACADMGVLRTVADAAADPGELLRRWADPDRPLAAWRVAGVTAALVRALADVPIDAPDADVRGAVDHLPATVRVLTGGVVDADAAAVADQPAALQILNAARLVAGGPDPRRTADILDLSLASEEYRFEVVEPQSARGAAALHDVPGAARCLDAVGRTDLGGRQVRLMPELAVRPLDERTREALRTDCGTAVRVAWWLVDDEVLVDGSAAGVGRVVAHLAGRWAERHRLVAAAAGADLAETGLD